MYSTALCCECLVCTASKDAVTRDCVAVGDGLIKLIKDWLSRWRSVKAIPSLRLQQKLLLLLLLQVKKFLAQVNITQICRSTSLLTWCYCSIIRMNKKLSYRRGTARARYVSANLVGTKMPFEEACNRRLTFKVIQGHCYRCHSIGHMWVLISAFYATSYQCAWPGAQRTWDNHLLACNLFCQVFTDFNFFHWQTQQ